MITKELGTSAKRTKWKAYPTHPHIPIKDRWEQVLTHSSMNPPHPPNTLPVHTKAQHGQDSNGVPTGN